MQSLRVLNASTPLILTGGLTASGLLEASGGAVLKGPLTLSLVSDPNPSPNSDAAKASSDSSFLMIGKDGAVTRSVAGGSLPPFHSLRVSGPSELLGEVLIDGSLTGELVLS